VNSGQSRLLSSPYPLCTQPVQSVNLRYGSWLDQRAGCGRHSSSCRSMHADRQCLSASGSQVWWWKSGRQTISISTLWWRDVNHTTKKPQFYEQYGCALQTHLFDLTFERLKGNCWDKLVILRRYVRHFCFWSFNCFISFRLMYGAPDRTHCKITSKIKFFCFFF